MSNDVLISGIKKQIDQIKKNGGKGRLSYPQQVKDGIIKLSYSMTGLDIAQAIGVSQSFTNRVIKNSRQDKRPDNNTKNAINSDINLLEVTDELKSFVKQDPNQLAMRLMAPGGITIEIYS